MIYFDNAATGGFKPRSVTEMVENTVKYLSANPGRSGHRLSTTGAEIVYSCRKTLAEFFGTIPEKVIFTKNCTESLNLAILGSLKIGGHVITTVFEHNSVLRPLSHLQKKGLISLDIVSPEKDKPLSRSIEERIGADTYLIVATTASNVTGEILPVSEIGALCESHGILFLSDGAQGGGHIPLNLNKDHIDMLALAGHKGLYGIMGSGALVLKEDCDIEPIMFGGTGTESFNLNQPTCYPEKLESGTLSLPAIASLKEGTEYVAQNIMTFGTVLKNYTSELIRGLHKIDGVTVYSSPNPVGIVSFSSPIPSTELADILNNDYDIAVRGGLHCAPLMHKYLGTNDDGLLRASLSVQNTCREIYCFITAVKDILTRSF